MGPPSTVALLSHPRYDTVRVPKEVYPLIFLSSFFFLFHHLQPADPTSNPACGHMTSPLTLQEVRYLSYVLELRGSTITRARRLLLLPVESVYPPKLQPNISSRHQHNTLTTSTGLIDSVLRNTMSCSGRDSNPRPSRQRLSRLPLDHSGGAW